MNSFFLVCEWVGTAAFAVSGAMIAVDKGMDLFGVIFLAMVTALGGGTLRDVLIGHFPPRMFTNYHYLLLAVVCAVAVLLGWLLGSSGSLLSSMANRPFRAYFLA